MRASPSHRNNTNSANDNVTSGQSYDSASNVSTTSVVTGGDDGGVMNQPAPDSNW